MFTATVAAAIAGIAELQTNIVVNERIEVATYAAGSVSLSKLGQGSNSIVVALVEGDRVAVQVRYPLTEAVAQGECFSSFSGFRIQ
jgi:hypothetical protein